MKKVAIVGVEGSGKTVMLAGLGDLYTYPDENGYFLAPKNFGTAAYVSEKIARMRKGEWPVATAGDEMQGLDWTLSRQKDGGRGRPENVCEVSFLDFPGEVYRAAYGVSGGGDAVLREQAEELRRYVRNADELIVLINLRDVIANGLGDKRVQEAMWITKSILDNALGDADNKRAPRAAIVLSQADSYAETIKACRGPQGVLAKYLPHVANNYSWLDILAASAVDKTILDDNGNLVPASDFQSQKLRVIMGWIRAGIEGVEETSTVGPDALLHFHCPQCYETIEATEDMVGAKGECPTCGNRIIVPPLASVLEPPPPPPVPQSPVPPVPRQPVPPLVQQPSGILRHFSFKGRQSRVEYWKSLGYFVILFASFAVFVESLERGGINTGPGVLFFFLLALLAGIFTFLLSNIVRRFHDFNLSWKWVFIFLIPPWWIQFIIIGLIKGTDGNNDYGPKP